MFHWLKKENYGFEANRILIGVKKGGIMMKSIYVDAEQVIYSIERRIGDGRKIT